MPVPKQVLPKLVGNSSSTERLDKREDRIGGVLLQNDQSVCFTSHRLNNTEKNYAQIAWISGTSTFMGNTTSKYTKIINPSRQFSRSHSAKHLAYFSEWSWSYKDIRFQFATRKERNFTLLTLCLVHLLLITLQHPMLSKNMRRRVLVENSRDGYWTKQNHIPNHAENQSRDRQGFGPGIPVRCGS